MVTHGLLLWQASVSYENTFASSHNVSGLLLFEEAHSVGDNIPCSS